MNLWVVDMFGSVREMPLIELARAIGPRVRIGRRRVLRFQVVDATNGSWAVVDMRWPKYPLTEHWSEGDAAREAALWNVREAIDNGLEKHGIYVIADNPVEAAVFARHKTQKK